MEQILVISRDNFEASVNPITFQEWQDFVEKHDKMTWVGEVLHGYNPKTHEKITLSGTRFAKYHIEDEDTIFKYDNGKIAVHKPLKSDIPKMKELAKLLDAKVIDSNNKIY